MFTKRFIDTIPSLAISSIIILSVLPLALMMIRKHPQLLGACLFAWFVYYFININIKDKKCYWGSSILFAMLIMTKYVFFYLSPFVLLWLFYCHRKQKVLSIKNIFVWFIPSSICFSLWSLRNIVLHGSNIQGMFGGYHGVLDLGDSGTPLLNLFPSTSRLLSMFTHVDLFQLFKIYFISILAIIIIIVFLKKYRLYYYSMYFDRKKEIFMMLLIFLLGVFIFFPGMTWNVEILIPKYFRYFLPVYAIFPFLLIYTYSCSWKKNYRLVLILYLFLFIYYFI